VILHQQREALLADLFGETDVPTGVGERLLRTSDVALLFQVSERTVSEWARRGRVPSVRTPGGHRRYPADQIRQLLLAGRQDLSAVSGAVSRDLSNTRSSRDAT
jgi:excisionase family DNA binding protein